jgi:hypothetical protein
MIKSFASDKPKDLAIFGLFPDFWLFPPRDDSHVCYIFLWMTPPPHPPPPTLKFGYKQKHLKGRNTNWSKADQ